MAAASAADDARLVLTAGRLAGSALAAVEAALANGMACLVVDLRDAQTPQEVRDWLALYAVDTLRIAGPQEQEQPGIAAASMPWLRALLTPPPEGRVDLSAVAPPG